MKKEEYNGLIKFLRKSGFKYLFSHDLFINKEQKKIITKEDN